MSAAASIRATLKRYADALTGSRPAFGGAEGAGVVRLDASGKVASFSPSARRLLPQLRQGVEFATLFADEAALRRAGGSRTAARLPATAIADAANFDLIFERRIDRGANVLLLERPAREPADAGSPEDGMLADLSHEMKTPLNAVIGFAEALENEVLGPIGNERYRGYARNIAASGRHLLDLVTSMLDLARLEEGRLPIAPKSGDPTSILRECADIAALAADEAGLALRVDIDDALPDCRFDPRLLRQILLNLLSNAVKFTSDGEVALSARGAGGGVEITVADTGVGMSRAELARLGGRFTALQANGVRGARGAGLGLALAMALAEKQGGALRLASAPGEGMTATLILATGMRQPAALAPASVETQLERIDAYRREVAARRANAARTDAAA